MELQAQGLVAWYLGILVLGANRKICGFHQKQGIIYSKVILYLKNSTLALRVHFLLPWDYPTLVDRAECVQEVQRWKGKNYPVQTCCQL